MQSDRDDRLDASVSRRTFVKVSAALASAVAAGPVLTRSKATAAVGVVTGQYTPDAVEAPEDVIYSVCQMCHSRCGIRAKVKDGVLVKIDGNPYHPNNRDVNGDNVPDRLPYATPPSVAWRELGRLCLKGQSGIQTVYDPYRIQHPLKRVGARNSGQWVAITWEQAFAEIAARINTLIPPAERDLPIDPAVPELGPRRNQLAFAPGRSVEKEMSERVWKHGWGTINFGLDHTSVCEATRHVANSLVTWDPAGSANRLGGGRTEGWQPDILGSEFIVFFGANPLEADFPMVGMARNLMQFKRNGGRYVVVDPRMSNSAAKASQWVPITPGTDAALAMGMISWIIDSHAYDARYLQNANRAAATADGEPTWSDATYLVGTFADSGGRQFQRYITARDVGLGTGNEPVVRVGGTLRKVDETAAIHGDLDVSETRPVNGVATVVKSAFTLLRESAASQTRAQYAAICGVPVATMEALASEFAAHGKKSVAMTYRGAVKHTNGLYNHLAVQHLNTLVGNYDWRGGCMAGGGGWGQKSGVVNLDKVNGDPGARGIRIDRAKTFYSATDVGRLFTGYPATRPWFPFALYGNYQEVIPSLQDGYPYRLKVLITYWNAWPYSTPALRRVWEQTVADEARLPLFVAISPVMGEVAAWADYVLPDTTYLEKFAVPGIPWRANKGTSFQRPVVGAFDGRPIGVRPENGGVGNTIPVDGQNVFTPVLPDTKPVLEIHLGLAKALGLPGVGDRALLDDLGNVVGDLHTAWDWAKAMAENIAHNAQGARPGVTVDELLAKGGVFDDPGQQYYGPYLAYRYGNIVRIFADPIAGTRDSVTGLYYRGVAHYRPVAHSDGTPIADTYYPLRLITYKLVNHGQARTNINPWLMLVLPENSVDISAQDAAARGIRTDDLVQVTSASNTTGIRGRARVSQRIKPGVVAISHHYGHWQQGSVPMLVNGAATGYDPSRAGGLQPTQIMRADRRYPNVSLQEPIGGSCSFYDTTVQIRRL